MNERVGGLEKRGGGGGGGDVRHRERERETEERVEWENW